MEPWTWEGEVEGRGVRVNVGAHALYVERADGGEATEAEHRAALVEALGVAVARMRALEEAGAALVARVEELRRGLEEAGADVSRG